MLNVITDSQYFTNLAQIKQALETLVFRQNKDELLADIRYVTIGVGNTMAKGGKISGLVEPSAEQRELEAARKLLADNGYQVKAPPAAKKPGMVYLMRQPLRGGRWQWLTRLNRHGSHDERWQAGTEIAELEVARLPWEPVIIPESHCDALSTCIRDVSHRCSQWPNCGEKIGGGTKVCDKCHKLVCDCKDTSDEEVAF